MASRSSTESARRHSIFARSAVRRSARIFCGLRGTEKVECLTSALILCLIAYQLPSASKPKVNTLLMQLQFSLLVRLTCGCEKPKRFRQREFHVRAVEGVAI